MNGQIQITIDADWIDSLMGNTGDAEAVLAMLERHSDTLYDYIDDAIIEMIYNANKETD
jgi:hypothetical protein